MDPSEDFDNSSEFEFSGNSNSNGNDGDFFPVNPDENAAESGSIEDLADDTADPQKIIQALIFASPEYIGLNTLKEILPGELSPVKIKRLIRNVNEKMELDGEPFEIIEVNNCFHYRTRPAYYPWIKKLYKDTGSRRLSQAALEVLSVIAYKQPVTKSEIEDVRGVSIDGVLKGLLDRRLIAITGRSDKIGNVFIYSTTKEFLRYFNISRVPQDLPKLSEFEDLISSTNLIPQISSDGDITEGEQNEVDENEEI